MDISRVKLRDFRSHERLTVTFDRSITVVTGANGCGKTNLLEAIYFGCTGRSCRTPTDRQIVRFGAPAVRVELVAVDDHSEHTISIGFAPGETKHITIDGAPVSQLSQSDQRPLVSVFMPDRLELITGPPGRRRSHLDQVIAALWPARRSLRTEYSECLAQRNALLVRVRRNYSDRRALDPWNQELARLGVSLRLARLDLCERLAPLFGDMCEKLGLSDTEIRYRPHSEALTAEELRAEFEQATARDLERGFTQVGPHRDDLSIKHHARELKTYGSRGQQRLALLGLLLAERGLIATERPSVPLMLLDDVMSELDQRARAALMTVLSDSGQSVLTTTEVGHVPEDVEFNELDLTASKEERAVT